MPGTVQEELLYRAFCANPLLLEFCSVLEGRKHLDDKANLGEVLNILVRILKRR